MKAKLTLSKFAEHVESYTIHRIQPVHEYFKAYLAFKLLIVCIFMFLIVDEPMLLQASTRESEH